jgi:hypothetical protein
MLNSEAQLEALLLDAMPDLATTWRGASSEQVAAIEQYAGRPLPAFYRWFLSRMGGSMGDATFDHVDFTAARVLSWYQEQTSPVPSNLLFIGYDNDEILPMHFYYDLDLPARDDARVARLVAPDGDRSDRFETFRELLAWTMLLAYRVEPRTVAREGLLIGEDDDFSGQLQPLLLKLGFSQPVQTGVVSGFYDRKDATLIYNSSPSVRTTVRSFDIGCDDEGTLRRILGAIGTETTIEIDLDPEDTDEDDDEE